MRDQRQPETRATPRRWRPRLGLVASLSAVVALVLTALIGAPEVAAANPPVAGAGQPGSFPMTFQNNTGGRWSDSQIYVTMLGQTTPGQWAYVKPDGTAVPIDHKDADAPGHLTKKGVNYANMSFTLAQASTVEVPPHLQGARAFVSLGSPMYIGISPDDKGWAGPDPTNPNDPNYDEYYDWYEFTYVYGSVAYGGNPTQVDQFGFPITARVQQTSSNFDQLQGISRSRAQVYAKFAQEAGKAFQPLAGTYRVVAPRTAPSFAPGGSEANYFTPSIDEAWSYYATHPFALDLPGETFEGKVVGDRLDFTRDGGSPSHLNKPTSTDVARCAGALASAGMTTDELRLGALFCAAFNRGVATDTSQWAVPADYYKNGIYNDYAALFHAVSVNGLAYGFAYDDVFSQSSVSILPNSMPPTAVTIGVGW